MKIGISDKETLLKLKINKHEITSTFSQFNDTNKYLNYKAILFNSNLKNMTTNLENIEVFPLSLILQKNNLDSIDLIKIDTEGHEYEVLYGTGDYIKKINYILVEFHVDKIYENYNPDKIHNLLLENGFTLQKKFSFPFHLLHGKIVYTKILNFKLGMNIHEYQAKEDFKKIWSPDSEWSCNFRFERNK